MTMAGAAASNLPSDSVLLFRRVREGDGRGTEEVGRRPVTEVDLAVDRELRRCLPADVKGGSQKRPPTTETASRSQLFGSSTPSTAPGSSSSGRVLHQRGGRGRRGSDRWRNREPRSRDRGRWSGGSWGELQRDTCQPTSDTPMRDHQGPGQSLGGRPRAMGSHRIGGGCSSSPWDRWPKTGAGRSRAGLPDLEPRHEWDVAGGAALMAAVGGTTLRARRRASRLQPGSALAQ